MSEDPRDALVGLLRRARRILVFTGAGVSTASGIPDYRGPKGVWKTRRPVEFPRFMAEPEARVEYWTTKTEDWEAYAELAPSATHQAIRRLDELGRLRLLVTQNVDGLHRRVGHDPDRLVEIHGSNAQVECMSCHRFEEAGPFYARFRATSEPPRCDCGGWWKPATISFGQSLREPDLRRAFAAAEDCDLVVALGSTLSVHPAAGVPEAAARRGVPYVICNQGPTDHDRHPGLRLRLDAELEHSFVPAVERLGSPSGD